MEKEGKDCIINLEIVRYLHINIQTIKKLSRKVSKTGPNPIFAPVELHPDVPLSYFIS